MLYRRRIITPDNGFFKDISEVQIPRKDRKYIHLLLFFATFFTTTAVGAIMAKEQNPFASMEVFLSGLPFSITILSILGIHEFGHYFAARYWGISVTLPYFIPAPILPVGTFGAVIKMKSSIPTRKALIDVGATGPVAGFIVAVIACIIGLRLSQVVSPESVGNAPSYILGESLLFKFLSFIIFRNAPENNVIYLHPVAFAGWIGLFITALNLMPVGQLDGGHILFALSPRIHELIRRIRFPVLLLLGITFWSGWYVWALLSLLFGRSHPYPDRMDTDIGVIRKIIAASAVIIFIICIMPSPISIGLP